MAPPAAHRSERIVPYPPPAAVPEVQPPAPSDNRVVWVDGGWRWTGRRYVWCRGGWVVPPEGARFVPWTLRYESDGTLWFAPAEWLDAAGRNVSRPKLVKPADYPPTRRQRARHID
jgi:hypothetical protein